MVKIFDYHRTVDIPAVRAVSMMQRSGMPIAMERATAQMDAWQNELQDMEKYVESEAAKMGISLKYSPVHGCETAALIKMLYSSQGLGLQCWKETEKGQQSTDDEALMHYAAVGANHREDDHPLVYTVLKIRSIAKARGTHLGGLVKWCAGDGAVHPIYKFNLGNTTRLSAEDPPVQQLPERADPELAKLVKACIIPRREPWLGNPDDWDPRVHGFVAKADVKGAEAVVRAGCIAKCGISIPYLRTGGDIHSKTASILYEVPEGTYKKGTQERDTVGKQSYFLLIFGGSWKALQRVLWKQARMMIDKEECLRLHRTFFTGYPDLQVQYDEDSELIFDRGYVEDFYGRRWNKKPPRGMIRTAPGQYDVDMKMGFTLDEADEILRSFENVRHIYANRGTQTSQATTTLWCIALTALGEYVELRTVPYFEERGGILFPEAKGWRLNEGPGPGGKPLQAWMANTVHDSLWFDGAPGHLEPAAKLITRRFNAVPADFLIEANMPWRVEIECGPDFGHLRSYNSVAKEFGLEPIPDR